MGISYTYETNTAISVGRWSTVKQEAPLFKEYYMTIMCTRSIMPSMS